MMELYPKCLPHRSGLHAAIHKLKAKIPIEQYAGMHTDLKQAGDSMRATCPIHGGDNPHAFAVWPAKGTFRCFACDEFGDLIDLCEVLEKHADTWTAVRSLEQQFGVEIPCKSERWFKRQEEKAQLRKGLTKIDRDLWKRRFFNACYRDSLAAIEDPAERAEETRRVWEALDLLSYGVEL